MSTAWAEDCLKYYGKVLTGKYRHWCYEWDELPIDDTCEEFECCICFITFYSKFKWRLREILGRGY
jgi:hypothetical protein